MNRSVNNLQITSLGDYFGIQNQGFESFHTGPIDFFTDDHDFAALICWRVFGRAGASPFVRIHFGDDPAGVRFDYLRTIAEVNFVTVVMWRIVAGGDDNAGIGLQIADSKGKFRSRPRAFKDNGVTSLSRGGFCRKLGKFSREMPSIIRDDNFRPAGSGIFCTPFPDVTY